MLLDNVGDIEFLNLRWAIVLIVLLYVVQLLWAVESLSNQSWFTVPTADSNLLFDTLWCFITIVYVLFILRKIVQQQVLVDEPSPSQTSSEKDSLLPDETTEGYYKVLNTIDIDNLIREKQYYLDTALTLQKLATHLGTNRQYLSNFINREKQKTFYEYINDFRVEAAKCLLDGCSNGNEHSMEDLASMSGFNSYSTFLRQFVKRYGVSPSQYLKESNK